MSIARMVACGNDNNVHIWDRRVGKLPTMSLPAHTNVGDLNSLQLSRDEQVLKKKICSVNKMDVLILYEAFVLGAFSILVQIGCPAFI